MSQKKITAIPTFTPTKRQRAWIEEEKKETGNSFATILRGLLEEAAIKKDKGKSC